ncbi:hypothetical protein CLAFUW4_12301 [Fulvia fulva]|uniref:Uncharacterized protein n=1 Tax=Passalora fulva TaxID=5499 RepID=A0A9Q8PDU1_PASFU|nr:uncharacterized protein CLAFUR5_11331 [Fulvia fulva]KAK4618107.1 hypothetical protein CLAFUR4_12306 [Fulvia fulva]KAK4618930.1 hypothetical protein CLAFUR0_12317 [Fulvia fulva]UJO20597.1 hypothetical protein CLAFUR5_11331 [Fulvia fulva]WPV18296.1 hypothetical protein CLAFUW4_12301 [Fulvia fulva]WPV33014.1 hypothetical protein CLAFUW7_12308 [Fulvia fulva]
MPQPTTNPSTTPADPASEPPCHHHNHALEYYQQMLLDLEQKNKQKLLEARREQVPDEQGPEDTVMVYAESKL